MTWLLFAFSGPVLWAISTHLDQFWATTFWMFVGEAIFGAALLGIASFRRQFIGLLRSNAGALLTINGPTSSSILAARSATATLWCLRR
jgi:hypothetical protein